MPLWLQHTLVLLLVAAAALVLLRQAVGALRGRRSKLGSCCDKGCDPQPRQQQSGERLAFIPVDSVTRPRHK
jgi:hypothetical protein